MGFIEIASVKSPEELAGIWNDFNDVSKSEKGIHRFTAEGNIKDGTRFFLGSGQAVAVYTNSAEEIADYVQGPGAFVFHSALEAGKYTPRNNSMVLETIRQTEPDKLPEFIDASGITGLAIMNFSDTERIFFDFSEAVYYDGKYNISITLQGSGYFDIGTADVLACIGADEEESGKNISAGFEELLKSALNSMRDYDVDYDKLMYHTDEIASQINSDERINQYLPMGKEIVSIEFSSIYPDEKSVMEIVKARRR